MNELTPIVDVEGLGAAYGARPVLRDAALKVVPGETFGLIGLNGAGKTTLIKILIGLRPPDQGRALLYGMDPMLKKARERLSYLPERFDPPWFLSGMEFLKFSAALYGHSVARDDAARMAEDLALDPAALQRKAQTYSKGMRQKLGLMGAVLTGADFLILDEPMSGLDPLARRKVKDMLLKLKASGRTIFLSSHILSDMDEMCDRVGVMHEGRILFTGAPGDLKRHAGVDNLEGAFLRLIEKRQAA